MKKFINFLGIPFAVIFGLLLLTGIFILLVSSNLIVIHVTSIQQSGQVGFVLGSLITIELLALFLMSCFYFFTSIYLFIKQKNKKGISINSKSNPKKLLFRAILGIILVAFLYVGITIALSSTGIEARCLHGEYANGNCRPPLGGSGYTSNP
jgi:hypothetical protein